MAGAAFLAAPIAGILTFSLLRWRQNARLKEFSLLIKQMSEKLGNNNKKSTTAGGEGIINDAFSMADKLLTLLPEVAPRKRNLDSLLFGFAAFILAAIFGGNFAAAILVGVIVWVYFRYETNKSYEREIAKFEEQKKAYEQRKNDFIETL